MTSHISIAGTSKIYNSPRGDVVALENIDLEIEEGEFVSILGPSGCGKSTLLKCIAGLERGSGGEIRVSSAPLDGPPKDLGVVFQRDLLLDWYTILQNVVLTATFKRLDRKAIESRAIELLDSFGLRGYAHRHPWELSGGMRQRVAIARTLILSPRIILMDEPFGALDPTTRLNMQQLLVDLWREAQATVFFVTHSIEEAVYLGDRVYVFSSAPGTILKEMALPAPHLPPKEMQREPEFVDRCFEIRDTIDKLEASTRAGDD